MYLEHFRLNKAPFQLTPDAGFLYMSPQHARARAHMEYAVLNRDSCVVVTGDIGCGKTTLINDFLNDLDPDVLVARIFQTQITARQLLQALLAEFGIAAFEKNKAELLNIANQFLLEQSRSGRQVVLIVDEAQNLSMRVLEEIRLLTDIETEQAKAINVIICGQPELNTKLTDPAMAQLLQRIHFRVHVGPLSMIETAEYIDHRLRVAGWESGDKLFPTSAMPEIYRFTGGVPRLINTLCDTAMTAAFVSDSETITDELITEAIAELGWDPFALRRRASDRGAEATPSGGARPRLVLLRDGDIIERFSLDDGRLVIGRDADNDIAVASEFISRHHAQVSHYRGAYWVMDLKSTNGTYVNGKRVRRKRLADKDVIALGHHRLVFQDPADERDDRDGRESGKARDKTTHISDFQGTSVLDPDYAVPAAGSDPEPDDEDSAPDDRRSAG